MDLFDLVVAAQEFYRMAIDQEREIKELRQESPRETDKSKSDRLKNEIYHLRGRLEQAEEDNAPIRAYHCSSNPKASIYK